MTTLAQDGFEILPRILAESEVEDLIKAVGALPTPADKRTGGVRDLLSLCPTVKRLANSPKLLQITKQKLGTNALPVRSIFFDKTPETNWLVPWHQDLTIAVSEKRDVPGFGPWSMKAGIIHVQPPTEILDAMLAIRIHLDDCDENNGALRVIPKSHLHGKLNSPSIVSHRSATFEQICCVPKGGALVMKPLLLHASSSAINPSHRRVIHIEYCAMELPGGLKWYEQY